jgi:hypothetical protein
MRTTRLTRKGGAALAAIVLYVSSIALAQADQRWFDIFANELREAGEMSGNMDGVQFVVGNNIWQPGREFKSGNAWLGLACSPTACTFQPAVLSARPKARKEQGEDKPAAGQQLVFKLVTPSRVKVVAWFSTVPGSPAWVKPGPVATWYAGSGRPKPTGKGSFEAKVEAPGGESAIFVPMALSAARVPELAKHWEGAANGPAYFLQLRWGGKRQLLPGQLGVCSKAVSSDADYLLWSGDLDGDGKPDYLISFADGGGQEHLYLSGTARPNQIVGLAGAHRAPPNDTECDGEGWQL